MSRRANEEEEQINIDFVETIYESLLLVRETRDASRVVEGTHEFEFRNWRNWEDSPDWPRITFFEWKNIENPEQYFACEFNLIFNSAINYYSREATLQGISFEDFAVTTVTVAHFVERAASCYPSNEARAERKRVGGQTQEPPEFRQVPFGEIFAILGTNSTDRRYETLLQGIIVSAAGRVRSTDSRVRHLPTSNFKAHSRFLILALSLLIDIGILHIDIKTYPCDSDTGYSDRITPFDRRVRWFQELEYRYDVSLADTHYCFTPQVGYSKVAWRALIQHFRYATDCAGHSRFDARVLNSQDEEAYHEERFDYDTKPYWCPAVHRFTDTITEDKVVPPHL
jgi:hypothetical protein